MFSLNQIFEYSEKEWIVCTDKELFLNLFKYIILNRNTELIQQTKNNFITTLYILFEEFNSSNILTEEFVDSLSDFINSENFKDVFSELINENNITTDSQLSCEELWDSINVIKRLKDIIVVFESIVVNWKVNKLLTKEKKEITENEKEINKNIIEFEWKNYLNIDKNSYEIIINVWKTLIVKSLLNKKYYIYSTELEILLYSWKSYDNIDTENISDYLPWVYAVESEWKVWLINFNEFDSIWIWNHNFWELGNNLKILLEYTFKTLNWEIIIPIILNNKISFYNYIDGKILEWSLNIGLSDLTKPLFDDKWNIYFVYFSGIHNEVKNILTWEVFWKNLNLKLIDPEQYVNYNWRILIYVENYERKTWLLNLLSWEVEYFKKLRVDMHSSSIKFTKWWFNKEKYRQY